MNVLGEEGEELQRLEEDEGGERWERPDEIFLSLLHPNLVHAALSQGGNFLVSELLL